MSIQTKERIDAEPSSLDPLSIQRGLSRSQGVHAPRETPQRPGAEYYDSLLRRLLQRRDSANESAFLIGLTGCGREVGVSTLAVNLAIRAADHHIGPVLLVDMNFRQSSLGRLLGTADGVGLADVLAGQAELDESVRSTQAEGLDFLPMVNANRQSHVPVDLQRAESLVARLRERYALVICDLPEAHALGDATPLALSLDAVVLVVRSDLTRRQSARQAVRSLADDGIPLFGAVVTDQREHLPSWVNRFL